MLRRSLVAVLLIGAFAVATSAFGWVTVPVIAAAWGWARPERHGSREAGLAAGVAWVTLLAIGIAFASYATQLVRVSAVMRLPAVALVGLLFLLPFVLGWSAARAASGVRALSKNRIRT